MNENVTSRPRENPFRATRLNDSKDFDPALDVASLNEGVSASVLADAQRAGGRREPDPGQTIPVILSAPGYGKTHLLGRLSHGLGNGAFFVFVGAIPDPRRPLEHIRWNVVESLFQSKGDEPCPLHRALADLFHTSFIEYVKQSPESPLRQQLLNDLAHGSDAALRIAQASTTMSSFRRLADSAAASLPHVRGSIIRALVLGWSPESLLVRRWLRGESLSEEEASLVGIDEESPQPLEVLAGVAAIHQYRKPTIICCDQLESTLKESEGPRQLTSQLIELLHVVPNTFAILSCLEGDWEIAYKNGGFPAFDQRIRTFKLDYPRQGHAVELLNRRLKTCPGYDAKRGPIWPFDSETLERFMNEEQPTPRGLLRRCADLFEQWTAGSIADPILFGMAAPARPDSELFLKEWTEGLEQIRTDPLRSPDHVQEARFYSALREAITLAKLAGATLPAVRVNGYKDSVLSSSNSNPRYGMKVELQSGGATVSVVAAVTTLNGGTALFYFIEELDKAMQSAAGAILFHPRQNFNMGPVARKKVTEAKDAGRLLIYALEEHRDSFDRLECSLSLLERAHSGELILGTKPISYEECQRLLLETKVLHDLDVFATLAKWAMPATVTSSAQHASVPDGQPKADSPEATVVAEAPAKLMAKKTRTAKGKTRTPSK